MHLGRFRKVGLWLAVSLLAHPVLLLGLPVSEGGAATDPAVPALAERPGPLHARLVPVDAAMVLEISAAPATAPAQPPAAPEPPRPAEPAPPPPPPVPAAPPALRLPFVPAPDEAFLPRSALTVPPKPLSDIVIPDVSSEDLKGGSAAVKLVITLFINEQGRVERIRLDTEDAEPALEQAAVRAFAGARFTPGELNGQPVKARMRIEIEIDPVPPPGAVKRDSETK